ncbi:MAG: adenylate kinase [Candidatus Omnitrophica bacterium]|nr:adenylate kinase [Candidatus Omnitrophota bacterium]MCM8826873.1 adenylate kinase [Candidatus Omnitrophota bacterium]
MRLVLLGAPGSGKGTQANSLSEYYKVKKVSLGDILREEVKKNSTLGKRVKDYMDKGLLVPDDVVGSVIEKNLIEDSFILEGYPRNINQAKHLDSFLNDKGKSLDAVVYLDVDKPTVLNRLQFRRICNNCGALYHLVNLPPKKDGFCDICNLPLVQRDDDTPEVVSRRLEVFIEEIKPIVDFYQGQGKLIRVDSNGDKDEVFERLKKLIENGEYIDIRRN